MERFWCGAANARRLNVLKVKNQVYVLRVRRERYKKVYFLFWYSFFCFLGAKTKVNQGLAKGCEVWRAQIWDACRKDLKAPQNEEKERKKWNTRVIETRQ